jgi:hypothetical protein
MGFVDSYGPWAALRKVDDRQRPRRSCPHEFRRRPRRLPLQRYLRGVKAFDLVLGESLWSEWRRDCVDVMSVIGPAMDTPTYRASMPQEVLAMTPPPIAPDLVVDEVLNALGSCPSFVPGQNNRELLAALGALPRVQQVEALAAAHAGFAKRR